MERPLLLIVSDLANGAEQEDILISDFLRRDFRVVVSHPGDSESLEGLADAIIIRNYWNDARYGQDEPWYRRWRSKPNLPIHDSLYVREGEQKDYLLDLYQTGYPVIPSIDTVNDLHQLPETQSYFIKPKDGFSAINARAVTRGELLELRPTSYLIQPFVDFEHEVSFYYLDKKLQYSLYAPDKDKRWDLEEFVPNEEDVRFAESFVRWNKQKRGIERIDACRLKDGGLLLVEVTDQGGAYLSIPRLSEGTKNAFLENLSKSLLGLLRSA